MQRTTILAFFILTVLSLAFSFSKIDPVELELTKISQEYSGYHLYDHRYKEKDSIQLVNKKWQEKYRHYTDSMRKVTGDSAAVFFYPFSTMDINYGSWITPVPDCLARYSPPSGNCDTMRFSEASEYASPHGNKLYRLFVKDFSAYAQKQNPQPYGQVLVKEVWKVHEVIGLDTPRITMPNNPELEYYYYQKVVKNEKGKFYTPKERVELFIMYKTVPSQSNDLGWVYGTMDISQGPENAKLIQYGPINQCIKCHAETKHDRIFGPIK